MITVSLNEADFEYDIHSLVKAFYPKEDVKVFADSEKIAELEEKRNSIVPHGGSFFFESRKCDFCQCLKCKSEDRRTSSCVDADTGGFFLTGKRRKPTETRYLSDVFGAYGTDTSVGEH